MGVTGLWRLIEPSGKPVPLETLENKVLAVDVSIWLHQAIKGFQDSQGAPLPNAHLLGIYHRVCKLLYFRVKPVFVFDGGVPNLKKETIFKRNQQKSKKLNEAERIQKQLLTTLLKHSAVNKVLSETARAALATKTIPAKVTSKEPSEDIYKLPPTEFDSTLSSDDEAITSESTDSSPTKHWDLHTIDEKSTHFRSLPADVRHEILTELKETRKQSSWGRLHELPKQSDDFSGFQMKRLLKRNWVQVSLEEAEKEMGGHSLSLAELEQLMTDQGVVIASDSVGSRIASDENTRYLLIKDVKKAMGEAKKQKELADALQVIQEEEEEEARALNESGEGEEEKLLKPSQIENNQKPSEAVDTINETINVDSEYQRDLEKAIQLSLQDMPSTSKDSNRKGKTKSKLNFSFLENFDDADFHSSSESEEESHKAKGENKVLASAKSYMMEYSGLTPSEIAKIIGSNSGLPNKNKLNHASSTQTNNIKPKVANSNNESKKTELKSTIIHEPIVIEEDEDRTVSSSGNIISKSNSITPNIVVEESEVSSSTNKNDDEVEVMSDDSNSDSVDDFLEVTEKQNITNEKSTKFEILIKPEESLEDDIFGDIFGTKKDDNINITCSIKPDDPTLKENPDKMPVASEIPSVSSKQLEEQITCKNQDKEEKSNVCLEEHKELTKDQQTKNVVAEFIQPLQIPKSKTSAATESNEQLVDENGILSTKQLEQIEENLRQEKDELIMGKLSKERMAGNLTEQIYQEAQELLQLFGVPFIVAPMEAEAQCAFLDDINLTDGTITDDSDIWLFGGKTVYKNFFNQHKVVMEFRAENIQHHFRLTREQMILLALLVGSDYTVGLQGVGPVTALEVLAAFPPSKLAEQQLISGLEEFRNWLSGAKAVGPGRTVLRNKLKNVTFGSSFPSMQVVQAYLEPTVDSSRESFSWAKPDLVGLVEFARKKFGWTRAKSDEILKPVIKRLNENRIQKSIKNYFQTKHKIDSGEAENKMSKRVKQAVKRIGRDPDDANLDEMEEEPKGVRKQKAKSKRVGKSKKKSIIETEIVEPSSEVIVEPSTSTTTDDVAEFAGLSSDEDIQILKKTRTQSKKKLQQIKSDVKNEMEQQIKKPRTIESLHKKDIIPQKEKDRVDALRSKMKAIEVFRKSKKGPGFLKKRKVALKNLKEDAELSESSSD